jgi:UDP-N-acetylglucosamine 2-epimerase (non-hydrolysing)
MINKILFVFGTRPEAIKMAPVIHALKTCNLFEIKVCVTAQHREMLDQVLDFFEIVSEYDLNLMRPGQDLFQLTANIITNLKSVLDDFKPEIVFVHGDTTTSTIAALAAFYTKCGIAHVEAGLRTYNKYAPFPEEINRQLTSRIADYHFAPTKKAKENLIKEGISDENIIITGNTVIDALLLGLEKIKKYENAEIVSLRNSIDNNKKIVLVTGHRRENFGDGFLNICKAVRDVAKKYSDEVQVIYPVHLNPNVQKPVYELLNNIDNIKLIPPLAYPAFIWLMNKSYLILTDSGGVQEEAPSLGKPVLVMRETTERPEAVDAGTVRLVGTDYNKIHYEISRLIDDTVYYDTMHKAINPYGDGQASKRIADFMATIVR